MSKKNNRLIAPALLAVFSFAAPNAGQDVTLQTVDGQPFSLASVRGKAVVMLFTGVQDPQCRDEFKALAALRERYAPGDVAVFWVSINSLNEAGNERLKTPCGPTGSVTVLRDPGHAALKRYSPKASQLPTVVILDKQGAVRGQPRGGFNPNSDFVNDLAAVIDSILK
jgi:peroxiredoxin